MAHYITDKDGNPAKISGNLAAYEKLGFEEITAEVQEKIEEVFQKWEAATGDLSEIEELLGRWKYLSNLLEKL